MIRQKYIWCDMETGGLKPALHDVTEIAGIIEIGGKIVEEFSLLLRPDPKRVDPEALRVTGRTLEELAAHPLTQEQGYREFLKILGRHVDKYDRNDKLTWVGQNPRFDMDFAEYLWNRNGDVYFGSWFHRQPADLISIMVACEMRGHYQGLENRKLGTLCKAIGVNLARAHQAIDDIRATRECFLRLIEMIHLVGPSPLATAMAAVFPPTEPAGMGPDAVGFRTPPICAAAKPANPLLEAEL